MTATASDAWVEQARNVPIEDELGRRGFHMPGKTERAGPCPVCGGDDRFSINTAKQVWNCRGCSKGGDVIDLVQHIDGSDFVAACTKLAGEQPQAKPNGMGHSMGNGKDEQAAEPKKIVDVDKWKYEDKTGDLLFGVKRIEYQNPADGRFVLKADGKRKKDFPQGRVDPRTGKWIWRLKIDGVPDVPVVPYGLPELLKNSSAPVFVVEGEAKVHALRKWGLVATCNAGGAGKWTAEHAEFLRGRDVAIIPDNDEPGRAHAEMVARSLIGIAKEIHIIELPGLGPKEDIIDWIARGNIQETFRLLVEQSKPWEPRSETESEPQPDTADNADKNNNGAGPEQKEAPRDRVDGIPLHIDEWLHRNLADPDKLIGEWLTSTSRVILNADTGLGKTSFAMAIGGHGAAGVHFLRWRIPRPIRVLYVDGEMSNRLLKLRAADVVRRLPSHPKGFHLLNRQDAPDMPPLNTAAGAAFIHEVIDRIGGVDLIELDNVMSLCTGSMKDEEAWQQVLPFVDNLTRRCIGQLWIHHTGYDTSHGYGTKTREWQMDTVLIGTAAKREDTDVSFTIEFPKARERTPETRRDFEPVTIALVNDEWISSAAKVEAIPPSPIGTKFLAALVDVFAGTDPVMFQGWKAAKVDNWWLECERMGLIEKGGTRAAGRLFSKYKVELITRNQIACNNDLVWLIR